MQVSLVSNGARWLRAWCAVAILAISTTASATPWFSLELMPSADMGRAAPGATVGWGYRLVNDGDDYLVPMALSADLFDAAAPWSLFDFPTVAPRSVIEQRYLPGAAGLFEITWSGNAARGATNAGTFHLEALWYNGDPLSGGEPIGDAGIAWADYRAQLAPAATVPEPSSLALTAAGLALIGRRARRRPRHCHSL